MKLTEDFSLHLLQDFKPNDYEEWRKAAEELLKDKSFDKTLITELYEGIKLKPIYTGQDLEAYPGTSGLPGFPDYLRSTRVLGYSQDAWLISQEITESLPAAFNKTLLKELKNGQTGINIALDQTSIKGFDPGQSNPDDLFRGGTSLASLYDLKQALKEVALDSIRIDIHSYIQGHYYLAALIALARDNGFETSKLSGSLGADPMAYFVTQGKLPASWDKIYQYMADMIRWTAQQAPNLGIIGIHTQPYHLAGADAVQECAIAFTTAIEYIRKLQDLGLEIDQIAPQIQFNLLIGPNFFLEIAKLRVIRVIWAKIIREFGGNEESQKIYIHARTGLYNKTSYDVHVNLLRTATEALSAVIGGCDSLQTGTFDEILGKSDEFSRRLARNQQLILIEECHFKQIIDPAGGSWYVESLTWMLAEKIWQQIQAIEARDGLSSALEQGYLRQILSETATQRRQKLFLRREISVGINMYANPLEKKPERKKINRNFSEQRIAEFSKRTKPADLKIGQHNLINDLIKACEKGATLNQVNKILYAGESEFPEINPLPSDRAVACFENLRDKVSDFKTNTGRKLRVFLLNIGQLKHYKAKAEFSRSIFEIVGCRIIDLGGYPDLQQGLDAVRDDDPEIVVICSADDQYPYLVPQICSKMKTSDRPLIVMAGCPADQIEPLKAAGVGFFIHLKTDLPAVLTDILKNLEVVT